MDLYDLELTNLEFENEDEDITSVTEDVEEETFVLENIEEEKESEITIDEEPEPLDLTEAIKIVTRYQKVDDVESKLRNLLSELEIKIIDWEKLNVNQQNAIVSFAHSLGKKLDCDIISEVLIDDELSIKDLFMAHLKKRGYESLWKLRRKEELRLFNRK